MSVSRIVVLLTPIFAGLAGWVAQLAAEYLPGAPALDETELTAVFVAGAGAAIAAVWKWLEGRAKWEAVKGEDGYALVEALLAVFIILVILVVLLRLL